jgi:hypothetical protein
MSPLAANPDQLSTSGSVVFLGWVAWVLLLVPAIVIAVSPGWECHPTDGSYTEELQWSWWPPGSYCEGRDESGSPDQTHAPYWHTAVFAVVVAGPFVLVWFNRRRHGQPESLEESTT